jgi:hypothetical protein
MADDSYVGNILSWLKGTPSTPAASTFTPAPPLANYPTTDDADYARKYGFSQGAEAQPFLDNHTAHVMGRNVQTPATPFSTSQNGVPLPVPRPQEFFIPTAGQGSASKVVNAVDDPSLSQKVNLDDPNNGRLKGDLSNVVMRAGLAANRIPIAAVGFDPDRAALDPAIGGDGNIAGMTSVKKDYPIYSNVDPNDPSTLVHESIHRGMAKLTDMYPDKMHQIAQNLPDQEMIVRYLMQSQAGDPETAAQGAENKNQRNQAVNMFNSTLYPEQSAKYKSAIDQMNELAINAMKDRGKRVGPQ